MQEDSKRLFVSVIVPVFNDQIGLDKCLGALAMQSWPHDRYEVIVVDNTSDPPLVIDATHSGIVRLIHCATPGSYAARNIGIKEARGNVLSFIDADCIPDTNWISAGVAALKNLDGCAIVGGEVEFVISREPTSVELYQYVCGFMQRENIKYQGFTGNGNLFVEKAQINKIGLYNENLLSGGDREWCWRARHCGVPVVYAPDARVTTTPRKSLAGAIRQARRVAGGRHVLRTMEQRHVNLSGIRPHREGWAAVKWILTHPYLTSLSRMRVFTVAIIIKISTLLESVRLALGQAPER